MCLGKPFRLVAEVHMVYALGIVSSIENDGIVFEGHQVSYLSFALNFVLFCLFN